MKKKLVRILALCLALALLAACGSDGEKTDASSTQNEPSTVIETQKLDDGRRTATAVYLGVNKYDSASPTDPSLEYRFLCLGKEQLFKIDASADARALQNRLIEGAAYVLTLDHDAFSAAERVRSAIPSSGEKLGRKTRYWQITMQPGGATFQKLDEMPQNVPVVIARDEDDGTDVYVVPMDGGADAPLTGTPGARTLKNLFLTAMTPLGGALYVQGGSRNWQNDSYNDYLYTVGLPESWGQFFNAVSSVGSTGFLPSAGGINEYRAMGPDSYGYLSWVLYNTAHAQSSVEVFPTDREGLLASLTALGWGSVVESEEDEAVRPARAGDLYLTDREVWLSLGECADGSLLILLCSSVSGSGVQLAAVGGSDQCQAYRLSYRYMSLLAPDWAERFAIQLIAPESVSGGSVFRWSFADETIGLTDPDGCGRLTPRALLRELCGEPPARDEAVFGEPVPESAPVLESWFDDAVFIGDSVTESLRMYNDYYGGLGKAQFLSAGSLSATNALWSVSEDSVHPYYNGVKMRLEDSVPLTGAKNVYVMLGMNNISFGLDRSTEDMVELIDLILEAAPDINIIIQSVTPMSATSDIVSEDLNNDCIARYNARMKEICAERGWYYVNVAEALADEYGYLPYDLCSDPYDMGIHLEMEGAELWVEYLRTHVPEALT